MMDEEKANPPDGTFSQLMSMQHEPTTNPDDGPVQPVTRTNEGAKESSKVQNKQRRNQSTNEPAKKRSKKVGNKRINEDVYDRSEAGGMYAISVPKHRQKQRASFDIFHDQKVALGKLQLAVVDAGGNRPRLGEMIQDAIDLYIQQKVKRLPNVRLNRETNE